MRLPLYHNLYEDSDFNFGNFLMRSGAVTNRTYRAWGKIKLPKYLFKLHLDCGLCDGRFIR